MEPILSGLYMVEAGSKGNLIFGSVLKRLRLEQSMTPEQLAGRSGVSTPFVNGIERGAQAPSMETAKKLLNIVGNGNVTITWVEDAPYDLVLRDSRDEKINFEVHLRFKAEVRGQNRRSDRRSRMDGIKSWNEGPLVDSCCPNENCSEHMIAVRYPATMEYVNHLNVVYSYFDLPMRCSTCGSLYPPANESQLDSMELARRGAGILLEALGEESRAVFQSDALVVFLYALARDEVTTGVIDDIINNYSPAHKTFSRNEWLVKWAEDAATRLRTVQTPADDPKEGLPMKDAVRGPG